MGYAGHSGRTGFGYGGHVWNLCLFTLLLCLIDNAHGAQFSQDFLQHLKKTLEPYRVAATPDDQKPKDLEDSKERYRWVSRFINLSALVYAAHAIYERHQQPPLQSVHPFFRATIAKMVHALLPKTLMLPVKGYFFVDALSIIIETMLYKTIAQLLLFCGTHDIDEVAQEGVSRSKKIIKALFV